MDDDSGLRFFLEYSAGLVTIFSTIGWMVWVWALAVVPFSFNTFFSLGICAIGLIASLVCSASLFNMAEQLEPEQEDTYF